MRSRVHQLLMIAAVIVATVPRMVHSEETSLLEEQVNDSIERLLILPGLDIDITPPSVCSNSGEVVSRTQEPLPIGTFQEECDIPGMSDFARKNCQVILEKGLVPRNALIYALEGLKRNAIGFRTSECFAKNSGFDDVFGHYSTPGLEDRSDLEETLASGIPNKCSLIINNYDELLKTHGGSQRCQAALYHIDLCGMVPTVTKSYSWVGYGTCKNGRGFQNKSGEGTSLLGFSVTGPQSFDFSKSDSHYTAIRRQLGGKVPAVALFGLQNTNNRSAMDYKYLHVGAYTSAGCPSIDKNNAWMIEELAARGPSVVVGYKEGKMEPFEKCDRKDGDKDNEKDNEKVGEP